jgi:hypothetical protein
MRAPSILMIRPSRSSLLTFINGVCFELLKTNQVLLKGKRM